MVDSGFINGTGNFNARKNVFEKCEPLNLGGSTSSAFCVRIDGKQYFMKRLKAEYSNIPIYQTIFRKEIEVGHLSPTPTS